MIRQHFCTSSPKIGLIKFQTKMSFFHQHCRYGVKSFEVTGFRGHGIIKKWRTMSHMLCNDSHCIATDGAKDCKYLPVYLLLELKLQV